MSSKTKALCTVIALCAIGMTANAQIPEKFTNLQVLPKDTTRQQINPIMRGFTRALGVRCPYCHVGEEGADLSTFDFASDEKPTKKTARIMLQNLMETNARLATVGDKPAGEPRVSCWTCHRGETKPASPPAQGQGRGNR